jgi:hypothetical protein
MSEKEIIVNAFQLKFDFDEDDKIDMRLKEMQLQLNAMTETNMKVRKKLFAETGELKKLVISLKIKNEMLERQIREATGKKEEWSYLSEDSLFF